jgi:hypothetical protein
MGKLRLIGFIMLVISIAPFAVFADDFDGSRPLLCAVIETFDCGPNGECQRGEAWSIDIPQFLRINFKEKKISGTREDGTLRTAKIENMVRVDGRLILQGVQNGRAWNMVITEWNGRMTMTASDDQAGFVVFGACTRQ